MSVVGMLIIKGQLFLFSVRRDLFFFLSSVEITLKNGIGRAALYLLTYLLHGAQSFLRS